MISHILSDGQSSRLYRSLVRAQQPANAAEGDSLDLKLGGMFFFFAIANAGKAPADVEKALQEQVDRLSREPVSAEELEKARRELTGEIV